MCYFWRVARIPTTDQISILLIKQKVLVDDFYKFFIWIDYIVAASDEFNEVIVVSFGHGSIPLINSTYVLFSYIKALEAQNIPNVQFIRLDVYCYKQIITQTRILNNYLLEIRQWLLSYAVYVHQSHTGSARFIY